MNHNLTERDIKEIEKLKQYLERQDKVLPQYLCVSSSLTEQNIEEILKIKPLLVKDLGTFIIYRLE